MITESWCVVLIASKDHALERDDYIRYTSNAVGFQITSSVRLSRGLSVRNTVDDISTAIYDTRTDDLQQHYITMEAYH